VNCGLWIAATSRDQGFFPKVEAACESFFSPQTNADDRRQNHFSVSFSPEDQILRTSCRRIRRKSDTGRNRKSIDKRTKIGGQIDLRALDAQFFSDVVPVNFNSFM